MPPLLSRLEVNVSRVEIFPSLRERRQMSGESGGSFYVRAQVLDDRQSSDGKVLAPLEVRYHKFAKGDCRLQSAGEFCIVRSTIPSPNSRVCAIMETARNSAANTARA